MCPQMSCKENRFPASMAEKMKRNHDEDGLNTKLMDGPTGA